MCGLIKLYKVELKKVGTFSIFMIFILFLLYEFNIIYVSIINCNSFIR